MPTPRERCTALAHHVIDGDVTDWPANDTASLLWSERDRQETFGVVTAHPEGGYTVYVEGVPQAAVEALLAALADPTHQAPAPAKRPCAFPRCGATGRIRDTRNGAEFCSIHFLSIPEPYRADADAPTDGPATMTVRVRDSAAEAAAWGNGRGGIVVRTVTIAAVCPVCGGPRGVPTPHQFSSDGEYATVDRWTNPCGHVDMYEAVIREVDADRGARP